MSLSENIREQQFKSSEVDVKEMKIFSCMLGTLVKTPLPVQWKIHFPVPYEIRKLRAVSQCTLWSNSLEETILYPDMKKTNWNHIEGRKTFYVFSLWCCGQLPRGKWSVVMMSISLGSRGRAEGTGRSTEPALLLACCRALHSTAINSITLPLQHTKTWGLRHLRTSKALWFLSLFKKKLLLSRE